MLLTTKDLANLPGNFGFQTPNDVAKLCREGEMFGYRKPGNFSPWEIPAESFAMYLMYSQTRKMTYLNAQIDLFSFGEDAHMKKVVTAISRALDRQIKPSEETYTIDQVSDILNIPQNQVQSIFISSSRPIRFLARVVTGGMSDQIPVLRVLDYLKINPQQVTALQERHKVLLENKDPKESLIRHTLMLYSYYKNNGYLV